MALNIIKQPIIITQGGDVDEMDGEPPEEEDKKAEGEGEDVIDPVMKQYMEMVQQQKDKEKQVC